MPFFRILTGFCLLLCCGALTGCSEIQLASHFGKKMAGGSKSVGKYKVGSPYKVDGSWYYPEEDFGYNETGIASWYGPNFHGKNTANGEVFDQNELTAAHKTLPLPSLVRVTNLENGKSLVVRVNDRGPFKKSRIIDVSKRAAELLGFKGQGTAKVRVQVLSDESRRIAQAAKSGQDTRGAEVPLNNRAYASSGGDRLDDGYQSYKVSANTQVRSDAAMSASPLQPVDREAIGPQGVAGHTRDGAFYPDPVVQQVAVGPTQMYVQAGSFSVQENAMKYAQTLHAQVYPASVNGTTFYRVRIPVNSVAQADSTLARLLDTGNQNAIIVVDETLR